MAGVASIKFKLSVARPLHLRLKGPKLEQVNLGMLTAADAARFTRRGNRGSMPWRMMQT
jgi:hypothetical protein